MNQSEPDRYWGLYCPQHGSWLVKSDGMFLFYPSPALAHEHMKMHEAEWGRSHLFEVTEFGKAERLSRDAMKPNQELCPVGMKPVFYA